MHATEGLKVIEKNLDKAFSCMPRLKSMTVERMSLTELLPCFENMAFQYEHCTKAMEDRMRRAGYMPRGQLIEYMQIFSLRLICYGSLTNGCSMPQMSS